jgi:hypothetical protein
MRPRWRRRVAVVVTYFVSFIACVWLTQWKGSDLVPPSMALFGLWLAIEFLSIFREGLLTKSFEEPLYSGTERFGYGIVRRFGLKVAKSSLTSRLRSTLKFQQMTEAEQDEALTETEEKVEQGFPVTIPEYRSPDAPDEREMMERNRASRQTLLFLSTMLSYGAVSATMRATPWKAIDVTAYLLSMLVIARTGPKARVLWREPDPREGSGEMELVTQ